MARKNKKTEMTVEMSKFVDAPILKKIGVKAEHLVANEKGEVARMDASNANIALLLTASDTTDVTLKMGVRIEAINWPADTRGYFNVLKFVLPKGTKIGPHIQLEEEKVLEFLHYKTPNTRVYTKIGDDDVTKETMDSVHDVLFPPSDLTDRPIPETDWSAKLVRDFHVAPEKMVDIAKMIRETPGMTWQAMYIAYANANKADK